MKAKLIKTEGSYILKDGLLQVIGIDDENLKERLNCNYLLSTKNCQAIENGYDLDELARKEILYNDQKREWWKQGAKYILEIMGNKKFSEDDMERAFEIGEDFGSLPFSSYTTSKRLNKKEFIQSLQKTEWDVEIEMEFAEEEQTGTHLVWGRTTPKLDSDGCLILKLKSE